MMKKQWISMGILGVLILSLLCGCASNGVTPTQVTPGELPQGSTASLPEHDPEFASSVAAETDKMDFTVSVSSSAPKQPESVSSTPSSAPATFSAPSTLPAEITAQGVYPLQGVKKDGGLVVNAPGQTVVLELRGVTLHNPNGPAIYVKAAKKVTLLLVQGTENIVSDGAGYTLTDSGSTVDGAIFSRSNLEVSGAGKLQITGNNKHGLVVKDGLTVTQGTLTVTATDVGVEGKDYVKMSGCQATITAGSDGIRSDNALDPTLGFVYLDCHLKVTAGNDGIQAETVLKAEGGSYLLKTGGGHGAQNPPEGSYKGIKAGAQILIEKGEFQIDSADDGVHSNGSLHIGGGQLTLSTGNDGLQAVTDLAVTGGSVVVSCKNNTKSNGIQAGGTIRVDGAQLYIAGAKQSSKPFAGCRQGVIMQAMDLQSAANQTVALLGANKQVIAQIQPVQDFSYVVFTSPSIIKGEPYQLTYQAHSAKVVAQ